LGGLGEKNTAQPVLYEFPSDNPSPFPPNNISVQPSAPYTTEIPHNPPNEPVTAVETPIHEAEIHPNAECKLAGCAIDPDNAKGPETTQGIELAMSGTPKSRAAVAADVNDARNAVLEGEITLNCTIAMDFIDKGGGVTAIDSEMCCINLQPWVEAINQSCINNPEDQWTSGNLLHA
jgi:hypothetical protein